MLDGVDSVKAAVGEHLGYSDWLEITQERVNLFAEATGDHQWIHVDVERAKAGPFGGTDRARLPHAVAGEPASCPQIVAVRGLRDGASTTASTRCASPRPVLVGTRIRAGAEMVEVTDVKRWHPDQMRITIEIEGSEKPACVIESLSRWMAVMAATGRGRRCRRDGQGRQAARQDPDVGRRRSTSSSTASTRSRSRR